MNPQENSVEVQLSNQRPPVFDLFERIFGVKWEDGVAVAWKDTIYCSQELPVDIIVHEKVHIRQQMELGLKRWLKLYMQDKNFRFEMEKEAYIEQANFIKHCVKQRNECYKCLREVAADFANPAYGLGITIDEAMQIIQ